MLRKIRLILATLFFISVTLLFLDFTGTLHAWLGWMAKIQFLPALLALNVGVVVFLILLTLVCGRVYCSVICPLGVFQDIVAWLGKKQRKNRYSYSPAKSALRYGFLVLFLVALVAGIGSVAALLAPYSSYGRIANNLFAPLWQWGNNLLAYFAERADSYAFYETEVWLKSLPTFIIAVLTFVVLAVLAWRNGRTYCNAVCPVGTVLGFLARYSWFKPVIDTDKCVNCNLCARNCKAACIDIPNHRIDYSRCVACMDCITKCHKGAIAYKHAPKAAPIPVQKTGQGVSPEHVDNARRSFLTATAMVATATTLSAQEKKVDGGLAVIEDKKIPKRATPIVPPGAMSYERGYCRPECAKCAEVCPTDAIHLTSLAEKSATQIGHAVWVKANCINLTDKQPCDNCARHCPTAAIQMVPSVAGDPASMKIPAVNTERCIGCGACENLCPARPFSAIYVEGYEMHREI